MKTSQNHSQIAGLGGGYNKGVWFYHSVDFCGLGEENLLQR